MNAFEAVLNQVAETARKAPREGDYVREDGLLICGHCHTPKQCRVTFGGKERVVGCLCKCGAQRRDEEKRALEDTQKAMLRKRLRAEGIPDQAMRAARFETARQTELIRKCRRWVEHWEDMRRLNAGLILWGGVGVGKSYAAACICNALIDRGEKVCMTSFGRIMAAGFEDRARFLEQAPRYGLLVLDDLGIERDTGFANETVFSVIDERYRAGKPLIVTTNLSLEKMRNTNDLAQARVFDRVLEMCGPLYCEGENCRKAGAESKLDALSAVLSGRA